MSLEEIKKQAQDNFDEWFQSATDFFRSFSYDMNDKKYKITEFHLHQTTERYYHTITLVHTAYKHKTHDLEELGKFASTLNLEFKKVFPRHTKKEEYLFSLLKNAYIDSRYKKKYTIEKQKLEYLSERVSILRDLTEKICKEKI